MSGIRVGIVGCGVLGRRRAKIAIQEGDKVVTVADLNEERAKTLAKELDCSYSTDWTKVTSSKEIDAVVVSTTNNMLSTVSLNAIKNGHHVLCEKPLGRNLFEVRQVVDAVKDTNLKYKGGFNLRYHPAIEKAKELVGKGAIGEINFIRCRYGITGRPGYDKEWRAFPEISGGGELLDQGIHVADLFHWFLGDFAEVTGAITTRYWKTTVEDNGFAIFKTAFGQVALMHVSWTNWRNIFSFEIYGQEGYVIVDGLGGTYGVQTLTVGEKAPPDKWPPKESITRYEHPEVCWKNEWNDFTSSIRDGRDPLASGKESIKAMEMIQAVYQFCKSNSTTISQLLSDYDR